MFIAYYRRHEFILFFPPSITLMAKSFKKIYLDYILFCKGKIFCTLCCKIRLVSKILIFGNKMASGLFLPFWNLFFTDKNVGRAPRKWNTIVTKCVCVVGIWEFHFKLILGINPLLRAHVSPVYKKLSEFLKANR